MSDNQALDTFDGLDYHEIEQAVMETSRGRWFLAEFARRHKAADTAVLLDAIRRLESQIQSMSADAEYSSAARQPDGSEDLDEHDEPSSADSDNDQDQRQIASRLDRTAKLVRRLRSSHKLISEAAEKPLRQPLPLSNAKPRLASAGDRPGFVSSDDDIFADDRPLQSPGTSQAGTGLETDPADAQLEDTPAINGDTLKFAEIDVADLAPRSEDEADSATENTERAEQQDEDASSSSRHDEPEMSAGPGKRVSNGIDMNSPTAANQAHKDEDTASDAEQADDQPAAQASGDDEAPTGDKPKKRIIVIRRPADQPGEIPLAGCDADGTGTAGY